MISPNKVNQGPSRAKEATTMPIYASVISFMPIYLPMSEKLEVVYSIHNDLIMSRPLST